LEIKPESPNSDLGCCIRSHDVMTCDGGKNTVRKIWNPIGYERLGNNRIWKKGRADL
jgi:hypothetical protein